MRRRGKPKEGSMEKKRGEERMEARTEAQTEANSEDGGAVANGTD